MIDRLVLTALLIAGALAVYVILQRRTMQHASMLAPARGRPSILYFRSDYCPPCTAQWRFLEQLQQRYGERIAVEKIDADKDSEKAGEYGVFTLPTTLIVDPQGVVRHANYGLANERKLTSQVEELMS